MGMTQRLLSAAVADARSNTHFALSHTPDIVAFNKVPSGKVRGAVRTLKR